MIWNVEWDDRARREFRRLDAVAQQRILAFLRNRIAVNDGPRRFGIPLRGALAGLWRYRVGDYRLICRIEDDRFIVLVLRARHRRSAYD